MNEEVRRRLHNNNAHISAPIRDVPITDDDNEDKLGVGNASDSESEEDEVPTMRRHTTRRLGRVQHNRNIVRRSARIGGKEAQYMGLLYSLQGEEDILDVAEVTNVVQRDEYFLSSVGLND